MASIHIIHCKDFKPPRKWCPHEMEKLGESRKVVTEKEDGSTKTKREFIDTYVALVPHSAIKLENPPIIHYPFPDQDFGKKINGMCLYRVAVQTIDPGSIQRFWATVRTLQLEKELYPESNYDVLSIIEDLGFEKPDFYAQKIILPKQVMERKTVFVEIIHIPDRDLVVIFAKSAAAARKVMAAIAVENLISSPILKNQESTSEMIRRWLLDQMPCGVEVIGITAEITSKPKADDNVAYLPSGTFRESFGSRTVRVSLQDDYAPDLFGEIVQENRLDANVVSSLLVRWKRPGEETAQFKIRHVPLEDISKSMMLAVQRIANDEDAQAITEVYGEDGWVDGYLELDGFISTREIDTPLGTAVIHTSRTITDMAGKGQWVIQQPDLFASSGFADCFMKSFDTSIMPFIMNVIDSHQAAAQQPVQTVINTHKITHQA